MVKPKIINLSPLTLHAIASLGGAAFDISKIDVVEVPPNLPDSTRLEAVKGATVIFHDFSCQTRIDKNFFKAAKGTKLFQIPRVGYDDVDIDAASEFGVPVAIPTSFNAVSVAEHAMMMALVLMRKALWLHTETSKASWHQVKVINERIVWDMEGKTVGIVGYGAIGSEFAKRLKPFNVNILYNKRRRLPESEERQLGIQYASLDEMLEKSDILSLHVPLTPETRGLIGWNEIQRMKKGAILLNLSRGGIVDEKAVAGALREGRLGGAGFDAHDPEPISPNSPLIGLENVLLTPHIGGASREAAAKSVKMCFENMDRVIRGEPPINILNDL